MVTIMAGTGFVFRGLARVFRDRKEVGQTYLANVFLFVFSRCDVEFYNAANQRQVNNVPLVVHACTAVRHH